MNDQDYHGNNLHLSIQYKVVFPLESILLESVISSIIFASKTCSRKLQLIHHPEVYECR